MGAPPVSNQKDVVSKNKKRVQKMNSQMEEDRHMEVMFEKQRRSSRDGSHGSYERKVRDSSHGSYEIRQEGKVKEGGHGSHEYRQEGKTTKVRSSKMKFKEQSSSTEEVVI